MSRSHWVHAILAVAALKGAVGLGAALYEAASLGLPNLRPLTIILFLLVLSYWIAAALMLYGGRGDRRAFNLAAVFLLIASAFADPLIARLARAAPAAAPALDVFVHIQVAALMPYFQWRFVREFPNSPAFGTAAALLRGAQFLSLGAGSLLLALDGIVYISRTVPAARAFSILEPFARNYPTPNYWIVLFALSAPSLIVILWRARTARESELRRVRLFVASLACGFAPILIAVLVEGLIPAINRWLRDSPAGVISMAIVYPPLLSVPFTTSYSVLVNRVLDVRLVVRKALQYCLARYFVLAAMAIPGLALLIFLYRDRNQTLADLLLGIRALVLAAIFVQGSLTLMYRRRIFDAIDRRFFRAQYDARRILTGLVDRSRATDGISELSELLTTEIDRALHPDGIGFLIRDAHHDRLVDPKNRIPALPASSELLMRLSGRRDERILDVHAVRPALADLPEDQSQWLASTGFELLLPLRTAAGLVLGIIGLGEKRSELPYSEDDLLLLGGIAGSAALVLENRLLHKGDISPWEPESGMPTTTSQLTLVPSLPIQHETKSISDGIDVMAEPAAECPACGITYAPACSQCPRCRTSTFQAMVPFVLSGKFRMQERIGQGGMGVVYRAIDMDLGREVAAKSLPRMSLEASRRLRREARAAAAVMHPNLAVIYGCESWRGTPILIFEYLPAGTLSAKIRSGPLAPAETLQLGLALADVAICIHRVGILHRDIKPSNIGYTRDGMPKLLDFGLAQFLPGIAGTAPEDCDLNAALGGWAGDPNDTMSVDGRLVGTPLYLPPEAVRGRAPDPTFDLWALAIVLYECVTGTNPMRGTTARDTKQRIWNGTVPDPRAYLPDCPSDLAMLFSKLLAPDIRQRPHTARAFKACLQELAAPQPTVPAFAPNA